jgi:hypothetical protein
MLKVDKNRWTTDSGPSIKAHARMEANDISREPGSSPASLCRLQNTSPIPSRLCLHRPFLFEHIIQQSAKGKEKKQETGTPKITRQMSRETRNISLEASFSPASLRQLQCPSPRPSPLCPPCPCTGRTSRRWRLAADSASSLRWWALASCGQQACLERKGCPLVSADSPDVRYEAQ